MKLILNIALTLTLLTGSFVFAQPAVGEKSAIIELDKDSHDYGTIEQGANGVCTFKITNSGNDALIISLCKPSCGCTTPDCPKEPILPGHTVEITVKYDTNRVGPINKTVTISSNASNEPSKMIRITGNVVAKTTTTVPANTPTK